MNTFLPYSDYSKTASCLDRQRLGKQRVECVQILKALLYGNSKWINHPAVRMWKGYEYELLKYSFAICDEWRSRGYADTCKLKMSRLIGDAVISGFKLQNCKPPWLGDEALHSSHRSNLLRKNSDYYGKFDWSEIPGAEYVWPV